MTAGRPDYTSQALMKGSDSGTHRTVAVDSAGNMITLMKGQYGGAPVTIAVDSSGKLYGLLQGDYAGAVKTLAVDSLGRMLAVLTDPEDVFGNPHYMGSAELAARLGSPCIIDRRGQIIFLDAGGVNINQYVAALSGAASAVAVDTYYAPVGPNSYKFTAGPNSGDYAKLTKYVLPLTATVFGFECAVGLHQDTNLWTMKADIYTEDGGCEAGLRYDDVNSKLEYLDSTNAWVQLAVRGLSLVATIHPHSFKFVVNNVTRKYVRAIVDNVEYDMSTLSAYAPAAFGAYVSFALQLTAGAAGTVSSYVSPILVTVNES